MQRWAFQFSYNCCRYKRCAICSFYSLVKIIWRKVSASFCTSSEWMLKMRCRLWPEIQLFIDFSKFPRAQFANWMDFSKCLGLLQEKWKCSPTSFLQWRFLVSKDICIAALKAFVAFWCCKCFSLCWLKCILCLISPTRFCLLPPNVITRLGQICCNQKKV